MHVFNYTGRYLKLRTGRLIIDALPGSPTSEPKAGDIVVVNPQLYFETRNKWRGPATLACPANPRPSGGGYLVTELWTTRSVPVETSHV